MPADGGGGDGLIRLGLSQRVDVLDERDERRDCLDQRWQPLFAGLGAMIIPLPNLDTVPENLVDGLGLNGIVLTGGNDVGGTPGATNVAPERDKFEHALITLCLQPAVIGHLPWHADDQYGPGRWPGADNRSRRCIPRYQRTRRQSLVQLMAQSLACKFIP